MERIPDFCERGEAACEAWAAENAHGDTFTCCCGAECPWEKAETLSPNPYAIPVCPKCFEEVMDKDYPGWREKMNGTKASY